MAPRLCPSMSAMTATMTTTTPPRCRPSMSSSTMTATITAPLRRPSMSTTTMTTTTPPRCRPSLSLSTMAMTMKALFCRPSMSTMTMKAPRLCPSMSSTTMTITAPLRRPSIAGGLLFGTPRSAASGISGRELWTCHNSGSSEPHPLTPAGAARKKINFVSLIIRDRQPPQGH